MEYVIGAWVLFILIRSIKNQQPGPHPKGWSVSLQGEPDWRNAPKATSDAADARWRHR